MRPSYNLSTGYISIHGLWLYFITTIPLRCEIIISCLRVLLQTGIRYYLKKLLVSNYHQKLNEMLYLKVKHFRAQKL